MDPAVDLIISCVGDGNAADDLKEKCRFHRRGTVNEFFATKSRTLYITLWRHSPSSVNGRW